MSQMQSLRLSKVIRQCNSNVTFDKHDSLITQVTMKKNFIHESPNFNSYKILFDGKPAKRRKNFPHSEYCANEFFYKTTQTTNNHKS